MSGPADQLITLGRYALHGEIASGGMATVYYGRLIGPVGFSRVVAVKRMHSHFAKDPEFVDMFVDEAQLAARIHHPNVVSTLDVVAEGGEIFIVMEYVRGESLAALIRAAKKRGQAIPVPVAAGIMIGVLAGLHGAHEARGERGEPLHIVHRDVSPHNVLVGQDGLARIVDFGVAKATSRLQVTRGDQLKGKVSYMAPEQLATGPKTIERGADVFAAGAVLWELLALRRLFQGDDAGATIGQVLAAHVPPLRELRTDVSPTLEAVVRRALSRERADRFPTAEAFSDALEAASPKIASARVIGEWVRTLAAEVLVQREARIAELESISKSAPTHGSSTGPAHASPSMGPPPLAQPPGPWTPASVPPPSGPTSVPSAPGQGSWPGAPAWTPQGAPAPGYHPSLTPVSNASGVSGAPSGSSSQRHPYVVSPSDASVASVALPSPGASSRKGVLAVAIGGGAGLLLLAIGFTALTLRSPSRSRPSATGVTAAAPVGDVKRSEEAPGATAPSPASAAEPASAPTSDAVPSAVASADPPPEPGATAVAPPRASASAKAGASTAKKPTSATAAPASRPPSTSYLPDRP